jgi:hypothetical protein
MSEDVRGLAVAHVASLMRATKHASPIALTSLSQQNAIWRMTPLSDHPFEAKRARVMAQEKPDIEADSDLQKLS